MHKILVLLLTLSSTIAFAANEKAKQEEMMKKWQEFSTPGKQHEFLKSFAGKWTYTQKMWKKKDSKPEESTGTADMKMVLGGRYLQQEIKGKAMGQDYEGMGLTGYDNLKKRTISTWSDNMGTSILYATGEMNLDKKTVTEKGEFTCPMQANNTAGFRSEWTVVDKNTMTYSMFSKLDGSDEFKMMEMTYKRTK